MYTTLCTANYLCHAVLVSDLGAGYGMKKKIAKCWSICTVKKQHLQGQKEASFISLHTIIASSYISHNLCVRQDFHGIRSQQNRNWNAGLWGTTALDRCEEEKRNGGGGGWEKSIPSWHCISKGGCQQGGVLRHYTPMFPSLLQWQHTKAQWRWWDGRVCSGQNEFKQIYCSKN